MSTKQKSISSFALTLFFIIAMMQALLHMRITVLPLWMGVSLLYSALPQIGCTQSQSAPELVIPLRITDTSRDMRASGWLSYSLHFGGKRHIVHMKTKKSFMSMNLPVFTYTDQGSLLEDYPFVQNDCYYHGYVEGDPESLVTVSTCLEGFQGMLRINGVVYEIKPKGLSETFEHLVYKMDSKETQSPPIRCGLTEDEIAWSLKFQENDNSILMQSSYMGWWLHQRFLELAIVVDHGRFIFRGSNISIVEMDVIMGISLVDDLYNSINLDVVLIAIEIWNKRNPFIETTTTQMVKRFCEWKKTSFNSRVSHDAAHIIVRQNFCNTMLCMTYLGGICSSHYNCGLECMMDDEIIWFRSSVTHELGHTLGMSNDDGKNCTCGRNICIMNKNIVPSEAFSNCSYEMFFETSFKRTCLNNSPKSEHIITSKRCGNGVVEDEELCDCGTLKLCAKDPCCLQNCTLKPGAVCASGLCCKKCQLLPSGTVCREPESECDLPEWCNGMSSRCPEDMYVEDGSSCLGKGFCYEKRCNKHDEQCKKIFGEGAKSANLSCYLARNTKGDRFGHCGIIDTKYVRCRHADVLCGRVQCENITQIPLLREHTTVLSTYVNNKTCWGTDYHFGMTIPDIGEVKDGTECGIGLMCLQRKCVPIPVGEESCLTTTCNMRGICNNKHHCHCNYGWAPPMCLKLGSGGSVDSGPPPQRTKKYEWIFKLLFASIIVLLLCQNVETSPTKEEENVETSPKQREVHVETS
uniref:Disintegrin and metalloproteinase domain-containing protein 21 n=1 Tax=Castor canadensis TaxID=51338 RepID=A0A8C0XQS9_CASCN